jgi:mono/diheme cytochrome c family protein
MLTFMSATLAALLLGLSVVPPAASQTGAPARPAGPSIARGKYLTAIMDCAGCHTGGALAGKPDPARHLAGSEVGFEMPGVGVVYPRNLTPDPDTGLGKWTDAQIVKAIRQGQTPDGRTLAPIMPWPSYAALTHADARAVAAYLKSIKPVRYEVPANVANPAEARSPYLTIATPKKP